MTGSEGILKVEGRERMTEIAREKDTCCDKDKKTKQKNKRERRRNEQGKKEDKKETRKQMSEC